MVIITAITMVMVMAMVTIITKRPPSSLRSGERSTFFKKVERLFFVSGIVKLWLRFQSAFQVPRLGL